ncbi:hypothetical protein TWF730_001578 [Orbilia blumenaviensis]|uniref:Transcription factor TFIIIC triple barrel domain-containing protein n=1 Tax=Orbilia blumenaviensis TaxID=1796055 RepID=A0AAV9UIB5_9PEZI
MMMEVHAPLPSIPSRTFSPSPMHSIPSPRFTPIAIAPRPSCTMPSAPLPSITASINTTATTATTSTTAAAMNLPAITPLPIQTPTRELWTDAEKYDLLWSIILSTGLTANTIPWHKIPLPKNHSLPSAQVVIQDIAFGKHHITHPTFTPSNKAGVIMVASRDMQYRRVEPVVRGSSKKRKLDVRGDDDDLEARVVEGTEEVVEEIVKVEKIEEEEKGIMISKDLEDTHPSSSSQHSSPPSSPISNPDQQPIGITNIETTATTNTSKPAKTPKSTSRRNKSSSPPINLDLSNPRITSYLKSSGYMNEDGTPVKKRRGRPTKDPFGLSVTLKKQLMRMDPNAPPMKKRGRPRKRFLDIDGYNSSSGGGSGRNVGDDESMRLAIEKMGDELVEELLGAGRALRDTEDDDYSDGYDGEAAEGWEGEDTEDDEEEGNIMEKDADENKPDIMIVDKKPEGVTTTEKMAVGNLVEKPRNEAVWSRS